MSKIVSNGIAAHYQNNTPKGDDALIIRKLGGKSALDVVLDGATTGFGKIASTLVADKLQNGHIRGLEDIIKLLAEANAELFDRNEKGERCYTTVSAAFNSDDYLHVVQIGDSAAYLLRDGNLTSLTLPQRSADGRLLNALGYYGTLQYALVVLKIMAGDRLMLVTDGITDFFSQNVVETALISADSPHAAVLALRQSLESTPALDDQTAIVRYFS